MTQIGSSHTPHIFAGSKFVRSINSPASFDAESVMMDGRTIKLYRLNPENSLEPKSRGSTDTEFLWKPKTIDATSRQEWMAEKPTLFTRTMMEPFSIIKTSLGDVEVSNAGYTSSPFPIDDSYLTGLTGLAGPALAKEVVNRLAARFGGQVHVAPTAVSQQAYDTLQNASTSSIIADNHAPDKPLRFSAA